MIILKSDIMNGTAQVSQISKLAIASARLASLSRTDAAAKEPIQIIARGFQNTSTREIARDTLFLKLRSNDKLHYGIGLAIIDEVIRIGDSTTLQALSEAISDAEDVLESRLSTMRQQRRFIDTTILTLRAEEETK
jgi:hypothetical protein